MDPRVTRIRQSDPTFDPTGKTDEYLDARVALLDGETPTASRVDGGRVARFDNASGRADTSNASGRADTSNAFEDARAELLAGRPHRDGASPIEEAQIRADADAVIAYRPGAPEGSWRRRGEQTNAAQLTDEEARAAYEAGPPACATFRK